MTEEHMQDPADEFAGVAERIAEHAAALDVRVAAAESLSSGGIANALGAAPEASEWFTGGVVAYAESVKRDVLGVTAEVITSAQCARELATGVAALFDAEAAVAVTGVGGPASVDGLPPGTVFIAVACLGTLHDRRYDLEGDPSEVVHQTIGHALELLEHVLRGAVIGEAR
jgi:nicotinamide-nucleotide amidase